MDCCENCHGDGWVCENHDDVPWGDGDGCCGGAGMPCPICNKEMPPRMPVGTQVIWTAKDGLAN